MSTVQTWQIESTSLEHTLALAEKIGASCKGGEVIELISDLGGGKTAFVRGLAKGMGSTDAVRSPSFTLSNEYRAGDLTLYHFDFYRLHEPGILGDELGELLADPTAVVAVEWADIVEDVLPAARISIVMKATGESSRQLSVSFDAKYQYVIPANT